MGNRSDFMRVFSYCERHESINWDVWTLWSKCEYNGDKDGSAFQTCQVRPKKRDKVDMLTTSVSWVYDSYTINIVLSFQPVNHPNASHNNSFPWSPTPGNGNLKNLINFLFLAGKKPSVCKIRVTNVILSAEVTGGELGSKRGRGAAPALRDLRYFRSLRRAMLRGASCRIGARG